MRLEASHHSIHQQGVCQRLLYVLRVLEKGTQSPQTQILHILYIKIHYGQITSWKIHPVMAHFSDNMIHTWFWSPCSTLMSCNNKNIKPVKLFFPVSFLLEMLQPRTRSARVIKKVGGYLNWAYKQNTKH